MTSSNGNIFRVTGHLCGEFTGPVEFPAQRPVTRSFDVFFDLRLNKRLSKQLWGRWFERYRAHYDVIVMDTIFLRVCLVNFPWDTTNQFIDVGFDIPDAVATVTEVNILATLG